MYASSQKLIPLLTAAAIGCIPTFASAAIVAPYVADSDTLHLYHFNEVSGTTTADAAGSVDLTAGFSATLGNASFTGFGNAGNTSADPNSEFLSTSALVAPVGTGGAFTYEAMVNISTTAGYQMIFSLDNNSANSLRPFQFRISDGNLEFVNIATGVQTISTAIPIVGVDAFAANQWFHVAATYNGTEATADNFKLYWTLVDSSRTEANLLGSFQLDADLSTSATERYGVGNDARTTGPQDKNLEGLIDQLRISRVARGADEMLFFSPIPEPSAALLGGFGALLLLRRRRHA